MFCNICYIRLFIQTYGDGLEHLQNLSPFVFTGVPLFHHVQEICFNVLNLLLHVSDFISSFVCIPENDKNSVFQARLDIRFRSSLD